MVEVKIFQDGELMGEYDGDYVVCIVSSGTGKKGRPHSKVGYAGNPPLQELRAALADGVTRVIAVDCLRKGKSLQEAFVAMAEFSEDMVRAGAEAILKVYGDEEDD